MKLKMYLIITLTKGAKIPGGLSGNSDPVNINMVEFRVCPGSTFQCESIVVDIPHKHIISRVGISFVIYGRHSDLDEGFAGVGNVKLVVVEIHLSSRPVPVLVIILPIVRIITLDPPLLDVETTSVISTVSAWCGGGWGWRSLVLQYGQVLGQFIDLLL